MMAGRTSKPCLALALGLVAALLPTAAGHAGDATAPTDKSCDDGARRAAAGVEQIRIAAPTDYWRREGFAEMVPTVRLPTTHDASDVIHIYLKVPPERKITARMLRGQDRATLVFPAGTRVERVEGLRLRDESGATAETVLDVRGTLITADGGQRFHTLRPENGAPQAPLRGWSWPAGDKTAQRLATCMLIELGRGAGTPVDRPPLQGADLQALRRLNDCTRCHLSNHLREHTTEHAPWPRRETDQSGFFTPLSVLNDEVALAATRPLDLNAGDPYVKVRCGLKAAMLVREDGWIWYRCADASVPIGRRDVSAGLRDADTYTRSVCDARRYLYQHMDQTAKEMFAAAFRACGLGPETD